MLAELYATISTAVSDLRNPDLWIEDWATGRASSSGMSVTGETAMGLSAYYAAIRAISEDCAGLPFITYRRRDGRGKDRVPEHPVYDLLEHEPNPEMTSFSLREILTAWALGWGLGIAEIVRERGTGKPKQLWPIHPNRIKITRTSAGALVYEVTNDDLGGSAQPATVIPAENILAIHGLGSDGYKGYSVFRYGVESIGIGLAAEKFGATFFGQGTHMAGVLETPGKFKVEAQRELRKQWADMYQGLGNVGKPAILVEGMKWQRLGIPPEEAQFLQTQQFTVEQMARWFRITPHKLQHLAHATFSNVEHLEIAYLNDTLMPWLKRWETEVRRRLFTPAERRQYFSEHLVTATLRGDNASRSQFYRERFMIGTLSQNDIRELENENPIDDGDTYYVPLNMTRAQDAASGTTTGQQAAAPTAAPEGGADNEERATISVRDAVAPVFLDVAERLVRREVRAATRAMRKTGADFLFWLDRFEREHVEVAVENFAPAFASLCAMLDFAPQDSSGIREIIEEDARESRAALLSAHASEAIASVTAAWEHTRAPRLAARVIERIYDDGLATEAAAVR